MHTINTKIVASIVLITLGILFFSLSVQKYQVVTSSRATLNLPQCQRNGGTDVPTNIPCASCSIFGESQVDGSGKVTVKFACEVICNTTGTPTNLNGCPANILPYTISDTSWFWCKQAGGHACTEHNANTGDLIDNVGHTGWTEGPWILSKQGTTNFTATFNIPDYNQCGRIQIDLNANKIARHVIDTGVDCERPATPPTQPLPTEPPATQLAPTEPPTSMPPPVTPTATLTATPVPTDTPVPTPTATPTATPVPTDTPVPTPTDEPEQAPDQAGDMEIREETPTPTPIREIAVNDQKPGITPWLMILVPIAMVLVGLFL